MTGVWNIPEHLKFWQSSRGKNEMEIKDGRQLLLLAFIQST